MKYSLTIAYAIQATVIVADQHTNAPISCGQIAHIGDMPERFLLRILRSLVAARILKSIRGSDGGYVLLRPPGNITLLQIIDAVSPRTPIGSRAAGRNTGAHRKPIDIHLDSAFSRANQAARREMEKLTVEDLMASGQRLSHPA
jgi:Rrf2 family protein